MINVSCSADDVNDGTSYGVVMMVVVVVMVVVKVL